MSEKDRAAHGAAAARDPQASMRITKVTYDGEMITVTWDVFTEPNLSGYIVTVNEIYVRLDNYPVNDPAAVSRVIGYTLQAGAGYQCWVTPTTTPMRVPDSAHASDPVPVPYNA